MFDIKRNKNPKWEYSNPLSEEFLTEKWMEGVVNWLKENTSNDYPTKQIILPSLDNNLKNIMELDLSQQFNVGSETESWYRKLISNRRMTIFI